MVPALITAFIIIAIALRFLDGIVYLVATLRERVRPHVVSWFFWGIAPMITFAVQVKEGVGIQSLVTLALGVVPLIVFCVTLLKYHKNIRFTFSDIICACFAAVGLLLWFVTNNPLLAIACGIAGDFFSSVPTLIKSYKYPDTEHPLPYSLSVLSMAFALGAIRDWNFVSYGFTLYMLLINLSFVVLIVTRIGARVPSIPVRAVRPGKKPHMTSKRLA